MPNSISRSVKKERLQQSFVDGQWLATLGNKTLPVVSPSSENVLAEIRLGNQEDVNLAVAAAKRAFPSWALTPVKKRAAILDKAHQLMLERRDTLAHVLSSEMGAAYSYAQTAHIPFAAEHLRVAKENLLNYDFTERRGTTAIAKEPIGVCGLITPWNWPLYQVTAKVGPALAAGCTVVLKPSELTPLSALLFAEIMQDAGVPAGVFNLVNGDGACVGASLSSHPDVDMISITGSTRAGILVAQAAANTVKRVTQELGGKSANILLEDADLETAVPAGVAGCFRNVGQSCSAPTRMLVPLEKLDKVEYLAQQAIQDIVVGDPFAEKTTHGPIANKGQFERVQSMIAKGISEGAELLSGGLGKPEGLELGFYTKPTIFSKVTPTMSLAREEIFGPVLSIIAYNDVDQAIEIANDTVYGLSAQVQSSNLDLARKVASQLRSGQVLINNPSWDPQAPFGGYKQSGTGREFGLEGFEEFLETKAIVGFDSV